MNKIPFHTHNVLGMWGWGGRNEINTSQQVMCVVCLQIEGNLIFFFCLFVFFFRYAWICIMIFEVNDGNFKPISCYGYDGAEKFYHVKLAPGATYAIYFFDCGRVTWILTNFFCNEDNKCECMENEDEFKNVTAMID